MWKSVGAINSPDSKSNRSREEVIYEPFAQASRLRLNESQLSGEHSPQFMSEYFSKKRSPDPQPHRTLSQRSIDSPPLSASASLRDINVPDRRHKLPAVVSPHKEIAVQPALVTIEQLLNNDSIEHAGAPAEEVQALKDELARVREEQGRLKKVLQGELGAFRKQMAEFGAEVAGRVARESESVKESRESVNPEVLGRIRQESARFNERMRDIENRKEQIREKYRRLKQ